LALSWFGGQPLVGHNFPFLAFPKTLAIIDISVFMINHVVTLGEV
jgi:hypothetical protein